MLQAPQPTIHPLNLEFFYPKSEQLRCKDLPARTDRIFKGPHCALRQIDLGIALGSAVKTASMHNVDTRIMYSVGAIARKLGLTQSDVVMGIPLALTGKSVFFDRHIDIPK